MAIYPNFQANRVATAFQNLKVWKDHSCKLGIYGTNMAVDSDLSIGDGPRLVCPVDVFDWQDAAAERQVLPLREHDCICRLGCLVCRKFATRVSKP